ncbi:MAG: hydrogenase formation protein HypD [Denitrovibrio sp.]|nr:MAG: hydrogenase formation protein HypD [Denitrovibrio sp.]
MASMIEGFRNAELCSKLVRQILKEATGSYRFMEVCGSHTMAIARFGIKSLLPENIELVSGPGCPVCVTPQCEIDALFEIAEKGAVIVTFGDMMRVPGSKGVSLQKMKSEGADVRIVFSPLDTIKIAAETDKEVVFVGIGFETTAPAVASLALTAKKAGIKNISITPYSKTMPEVLGLLLSDENLKINGFICPGHVTAVTGLSLYEPVVSAGMSAVVTGFEPVDILTSILEMVRQTNNGEFKAVNSYSRVVADEGNAKARSVIDEVYYKKGCWWRGIGYIEDSGLAFRDEYAEYDAFKKFDVSLQGDDEIEGCSCGEVLKGYIKPSSCSLFGTACTPESPVGPCMVSSEGACAALYKYS